MRWPRVRAAILTGLDTPTEALWARFAAQVERERQLALNAANLITAFTPVGRGPGATGMRQAAQRHADRAQHLTEVTTALEASQRPLYSG
jgi:hypothetical protein